MIPFRPRVRPVRCLFWAFFVLTGLLCIFALTDLWQGTMEKQHLPEIQVPESTTQTVPKSAHQREELATPHKRVSDGPEKKDPVNNNVHIFYYAWYGSPKYDGEWIHWNHEYILPWDKNDAKVYPTGKHDPNVDDVGANFFPELGAYSSRDPEIIGKHMEQIQKSGAGVIVVSWYPPNSSDENGKPVDALLPSILDAADKEGLKVALHVEPYTGRNADSFRSNLEYVVSTHAKHPAFYKRRKGNKLLPVYYIYDSYRSDPSEWEKLFSKSGNLTVRDTELDGIFLGLFVEARHRAEILQAKFDGFYTYFAANSFTYGSTIKNWNLLSKFARSNNLMFVPSVGPGYIDTRVRPWNGVNTRHRRKGEYYNLSWKSAISAGPPIVSITSFNEWHEGTQIEPAIPKSLDGYTYMSYEPEKPEAYIIRTREWATKFAQSKQAYQKTD